MAILQDSVITIALNRTQKPISLLDGDSKFVQVLSREEIDEYLARGYEAHGTKRCLRYLRPPAPRQPTRPEAPHMPCWLNQSASVIRFWADQVTPGFGSALDRVA